MRLPQRYFRSLSVHCIHFSLISTLLLVFGATSVHAGTTVPHQAGSRLGSGSVTASPSSLSFGQVAVGSKASLQLVLTNSQSKKMRISSVQTTTNLFSISGPAFPLTLSGGGSVTLTVTFTPKSSGLVGDSVSVAGSSVSIPLTGTGTMTAVGQLRIAPSALNYGDVSVGTTGTLPLSLSAVGASVTITSASSSSSQFILEGSSFPMTIASGQSKSVNVGFTPKSSGTVSGSLSFASNASNSQATESVTGIGTVTPYSVSLYWNASSNVVGYNVYRGTSSNGPFSKINPTVDANTAYTDGTVVSGNTYYYAATSVNSSGAESSLSTPPVPAVVP